MKKRITKDSNFRLSVTFNWFVNSLFDFPIKAMLGKKAPLMTVQLHYEYMEDLSVHFKTNQFRSMTIQIRKLSKKCDMDDFHKYY